MKTILIIEDNLSYQSILKEALEEQELASQDTLLRS